MKKSTRNILIAVIGVVVLVGVLLAVIFLLPSGSSENNDVTTVTYPTDENGEQYAVDSKGNKIPSIKDNNGNIISAGVETLCEQGPLQLTEINVENEGGTFKIIADTKTVKATGDDGEEVEKTEATVYTLVGFEDWDLQSGQPAAIANDISNLETTKIIDINGENPAEFGLDKPRATVTAKFKDGTENKVIVGNDAPSDLGVYIMYGDKKTIYLVDNDSVDSFFFSPIDLISKEITPSSTDEESAEIVSMTLTGAQYPEKIVIVPNDDETNDAYYKMTSPYEEPVNVTAGSNITGAIKGLTADSVVALNPSDSQLAKYGLDKPAATAVTEFSDVKYTMSASPAEDGAYYLYSKDKNIIYTVPAGKVTWAGYTYDDLKYEYILKPNTDYLSKLTITADGKTYSFDISKEEKTDDEGNVTKTLKVKNGDKEIKTEYFNTFYDNLTFNERKASASGYSASGKPVLTVEFAYNNGKAPDRVEYYSVGDRKLLAVVNGRADGIVYETYTNKIISDTPVIAKNERVDPA